MNYEQALAALAEPNRRKIMEELRKGPLGVGELADRFPISQPAISQHLKVLREAALVAERPQGTKRIYRINYEGLEPLRAWIDLFWAETLDAFKEELERDE